MEAKTTVSGRRSPALVSLICPVSRAFPAWPLTPGRVSDRYRRGEDVMSDDRPVAGTTTATRARVAVIFGGTSGEHGVSCLTAAAVLGAMNPDRYDVVGVGITPSGRWVRVSEAAIASLRQTNGHLPVLGEDAHDAML